MAWFTTLIKELYDFSKEVSGSYVAHSFFIDGDRSKGVRPEFQREHAPSFSVKQKDEARFNGIKTRLALCLQMAIENFLGLVGRNQRADFILTIAEMTVSAAEGDTQKSEDRALETLERIANEPDHDARIHICYTGRLMKAQEYHYLLGAIEHIAHRTFDNWPQAWNWLRTQGPVVVHQIWALVQLAAEPAVDAMRDRLAQGPNTVGSQQHADQTLNTALAHLRAMRNRL